MELLKVTKAEYLSDYLIRVTFNNDCSLICNLGETVQSGVFKGLKEVTLFKNYSVRDGVVEWPGEIDIAPEFLYKIGVPVPGSVKSPEPDYIRWTA